MVVENGHLMMVMQIIDNDDNGDDDNGDDDNGDGDHWQWW